MTKKELEEKVFWLSRQNSDLIYCIKKTLWMARRYAHGRNTYAPDEFRNAYNELKIIGVTIGFDEVIDETKYEGKGLESDYLNDCN